MEFLVEDSSESTIGVSERLRASRFDESNGGGGTQTDANLEPGADSGDGGVVSAIEPIQARRPAR